MNPTPIKATIKSNAITGATTLITFKPVRTKFSKVIQSNKMYTAEVYRETVKEARKRKLRREEKTFEPMKM